MVFELGRCSICIGKPNVGNDIYWQSRDNALFVGANYAYAN